MKKLLVLLLLPALCWAADQQAATPAAASRLSDTEQKKGGEQKNEAEKPDDKVQQAKKDFERCEKLARMNIDFLQEGRKRGRVFDGAIARKLFENREKMFAALEVLEGLPGTEHKLYGDRYLEQGKIITKEGIFEQLDVLNRARTNSRLW